jgi:hypothetical protein
MKYVLATLQSVLTILFAYRLFHSSTTFSVLLGLFGTALFATLAFRNIMQIRRDDEKSLFGAPRDTLGVMPIHPAPTPVNAGPFANDLVYTPAYTATANTVPTGHNSTLGASVPQAPWSQDSSGNVAGTMLGGMALGAAGYAVAQAWTHEYAPSDHGMLAQAPSSAPVTIASEPSMTTEPSSAPTTSTSTDTYTTSDSSPSFDSSPSGGSFE